MDAIDTYINTVIVDKQGWLLELYVLATPKVISGWVWTCDSAQSWQLYNVTPLGNQAASTMTQYPTQLYYSDKELTSPCPWLIAPSAKL